jgi:hypothetical protein
MNSSTDIPNASVSSLTAQVPFQFSAPPQDNQNSIVSNPSRNEIGIRQLAPMENPLSAQQIKMNSDMEQYKARYERDNARKVQMRQIAKETQKGNKDLIDLQQKEKDALLAEAHEGDNADEFEEALSVDNFDDYIPCKFHCGIII